MRRWTSDLPARMNKPQSAKYNAALAGRERLSLVEFPEDSKKPN